MNKVCLQREELGRCTNLHAAIFLDILNVINVKMCMMVVRIELFPCILFLVILI